MSVDGNANVSHGWLVSLAQQLPQTLALAIVDSSTSDVVDVVETGLESARSVDLEAVVTTATDFSLGDELLELQSLVRDETGLAGGRRETLLLAAGHALLFVTDRALEGSTLLVVCNERANLGLVLAQVRQAVQGLLEEQLT